MHLANHRMKISAELSITMKLLFVMMFVSLFEIIFCPSPTSSNEAETKSKFCLSCIPEKLKLFKKKSTTVMPDPSPKSEKGEPKKFLSSIMKRMKSKPKSSQTPEKDKSSRGWLSRTGKNTIDAIKSKIPRKKSKNQSISSNPPSKESPENPPEVSSPLKNPSSMNQLPPEMENPPRDTTPSPVKNPPKDPSPSKTPKESSSDEEEYVLAPETLADPSDEDERYETPPLTPEREEKSPKELIQNEPQKTPPRQKVLSKRARSFNIPSNTPSRNVSPSNNEITQPVKKSARRIRSLNITPSSDILPLMMQKTRNSYDYPNNVKKYLRTLAPESSSRDDTQRILFFCPDENKPSDRCLFEKDFPTSRPRCTIEPRPFIQKLMMQQPESRGDSGVIDGSSQNTEKKLIHAPCGPRKSRGKLYTFGYEICIRKELGEIVQEENHDRHEVEMYSFCYSHKNQETIFTQHTIFSPALLLDEYMRSEQETSFVMQTYDDNNQFRGVFVIMEEIYAESFNSESSTSEPQKLVPPEDLAFAVWKKPTYHFVNTRPMHQKLIKLWDFIGDLIRTDAAQHGVPYDIFTGAFKLPEDLNNARFVYQDQIPVPELWVKIVYFQEKQGKQFGFAVIANNFVVDDPSNQNHPSSVNLDTYCKTDLCDISQRPSVFGEYIDIGHYVRCCKISKPIMTLFNFDLNAKFVIPVEKLIVKKPVLDDTDEIVE